MFSIDQNCHPLWDVVPKLHALTGRSIPVRHFIEDIDTAFTAIGATPGETPLRIARERFHRSGGADWGAALFYSQFLGRLAVDVRLWEPMTGMSTHALARGLGRTVDDLYDEFSPSDNWQLIGPSYVDERCREYHRTIADLSVRETAPFVREIIARAKSDCLRAFPADESRKRIAEWFAGEEQHVDLLLARCAEGSLVEFYRRWLGRHVAGRAELGLTSELFSLETNPQRAEVLEVFLRDYDLAAGLYNEALAEAHVGLRALRIDEGELPFFAAMDRDGRKVRSAAHFSDGKIYVGERSFRLDSQRHLPMDDLKSAGVRCLAGKAILLVIQVRMGETAEPLALPFRGSLYMPAAHLLAEKLQSHGLLADSDTDTKKLHPLIRVRFRLLDRMGSLETPIRLPEHLAAAFGRAEIPASTLAENWRAISAEAAGQLGRFRNPDDRLRWQRENMPALFQKLSELEVRRRELARRDPKSPEIRQASKDAKAIRTEILDATVRRIDRDTQLSQLDTWDSRGALLPWCIALGGKTFYDEVVSRAEIYEENPKTAETLKNEP